MSQHRSIPAVVIVTVDLDDHEACAVTERAPPYFDEGASLDSLDVIARDGTAHTPCSSEPP